MTNIVRILGRMPNAIRIATATLIGLAVLLGPTAAPAATSGPGSPTTGVAAAVPTGIYEIRSPYRPGECLQTGPGINQLNDTLLAFYPCNGEAPQRWSFEDSPATGVSAYRRVRSVFEGRCLDADNRGGHLTSIIHLYGCNNSFNQAWAFPDPPGQGLVCVLAAPACDLALELVTTQGGGCARGTAALACLSADHGPDRLDPGPFDTGPDIGAPYTLVLAPRFTVGNVEVLYTQRVG